MMSGEADKPQRGNVANLVNRLSKELSKPPPDVVQPRKAAGEIKNRRAKVAYSYSPAHEDELTLQADEIIEILSEEEEGWWRGKLNGKIGVFPANFVKLIDEATTLGSGNRTSILSPSTPMSGGGGHLPPSASQHLSRSPGRGTEEHSEDEKHDHDQVAPKKPAKIGFGNIFNANNKIELRPTPGSLHSTVASSSGESGVTAAGEKGHVNSTAGVGGSGSIKRPSPSGNGDSGLEYKPSKKQAPDPPDPVPSNREANRNKRLAKVLYSYEALNVDELTLEEGDIINVLKTDCEDPGWWFGELGNKRGVFPDNFVELLPDEPSTPSSTAATSTTKSSKPVSSSLLATQPPAVPAKPKLGSGSSSGATTAAGGSVIGGGAAAPISNSSASATPASNLLTGHSLRATTPDSPPTAVSSHSTLANHQRVGGAILGGTIHSASTPSSSLIGAIKPTVNSAGSDYSSGNSNNSNSKITAAIGSSSTMNTTSTSSAAFGGGGVLLGGIRNMGAGTISNSTTYIDPTNSAKHSTSSISAKLGSSASTIGGDSTNSAKTKSPPASQISDPPATSPPIPSGTASIAERASMLRNNPGGFKLPGLSALPGQFNRRQSPNGPPASDIGPAGLGNNKPVVNGDGETKIGGMENGEGVNGDADSGVSSRLSHLTTSRPKNPNRRPPSQVFLSSLSTTKEISTTIDSGSSTFPQSLISTRPDGSERPCLMNLETTTTVAFRATDPGGSNADSPTSVPGAANTVSRAEYDRLRAEFDTFKLDTHRRIAELEDELNRLRPPINL